MESELIDTAGQLSYCTERFAVNPHPLSNRIRRCVWSLCYTLLYRPSPNVAHRFRVLLLRAFGADIHDTAHPYPKCKIWAPWNLAMGAHSCLANQVDCYNVARIELEEYAIVSQYSYLCSASHDFNDVAFPLFSKPIRIKRQAWVAARAYVGPGVTIGAGAVVGANSCAYKNVEPWTVVGGNPARVISRRNLA